MSCCNKNQCCQNQVTSNSQDYLVCTCMGVMKSDILEAIEQGADSFEALSEELGVGTGCSTCVEEVQQLLAQKKQKCCSN